jgi:hypothetical protein
MVPAPRLRHAGAVAAASSPDADDDRTQFISARSDLMRPVPGAVAAADAVTAAMTMPADPVERVTPAVERPLSSLVFVPLLALAGIVLAAATLPSLMWRRALLNNAVADSASISLLWLALPVAVALIATYVVTILITRRFSSALSAVERDRT